jgi:RNA polymerase sigma-70 factor (ECF subfamily)
MTDFLNGETSRESATARSAAAGDPVAFTRLVADHHAAMARVAFVVCGDPEITRDAVQAAWVQAWRRIESLRQPEQVRSWLVAIAANEARQAVRRRARAAVVDISAVVDRAGDPDPIEGVSLLDLARVLGGLKPDDRALLALRFEAGLDSTRIASQMGMSASGVRSRLARLLDRLRADLALDGEVAP